METALSLEPYNDNLCLLFHVSVAFRIVQLAPVLQETLSALLGAACAASEA